MTRFELEEKLRALNNEYTEKMNVINRRKDDLLKKKADSTLLLRGGYHNRKKAKIHEINELLEKKSRLYKGDPLFDEYAAKIRILQGELSIIKSDNEMALEEIKVQTYKERIDLDNEARKINEWLEAEKQKVRGEFEADNPDAATFNKAIGMDPNGMIDDIINNFKQVL